MSRKKFEVPPEKLRFTCDPDKFSFSDTSTVAPQADFIGQDRAIKSLRYGLEVGALGHNIFVTGLSGSGRNTVIREHLKSFVAEKQAKGECVIFDYCYVCNIGEPDNPALLILEKGGGKKFQRELERVLSVLQEKIPAFFADEKYLDQIDIIGVQFREKTGGILSALDQFAKERELLVYDKDASSGEDIPRLRTLQEILLLPRSEQKKISSGMRGLRKVEEKSKVELSRLREEVGEQTDGIGRAGVGKILDSVFASISYRDNPAVEKYLSGLCDFVLDNIKIFLPKEEQPQMFPFPQMDMARKEDPFLPFEVNVVVDNSAIEGMPIIFEHHPTFANLFGRIGRTPVHGTYFTDHTKIKAGSLMRANGGFLVVNILNPLWSSATWYKFKIAIKHGRLHLEDPMEHLGFLMPEGVEPESVPINVKVIAVGESSVYDSLFEYDEDFPTIFKVKAEFDYEMERTEDNIQSYAGVISLFCQEESLLPFNKSAVAKIVEHGIRLVTDQGMLSTRFGIIKNLVVESDYCARKANSAFVFSEHVRQAVEAQRRRVNLIEEKTHRAITSGIIFIDTHGKKVGQINGLSVFSPPDFDFGSPSRITVQTFIGRSGIISIERESKLSGQIFGKAVLTLSGYFGAKYGQNNPLSFVASICFEQTYGRIEGDSASAAELLAIISSLSGLPIDQGLAITGSMNQPGEIQPIGGINHKIEGFFDICKAAGLNGKQGVIMPKSNVWHLMLREDVAEAVKNKQFHVWSVRNIDEAILLVFGKKAGERLPDGGYPEGSVNYLVMKRLQDFAKKAKESDRPKEV